MSNKEKPAAIEALDQLIDHIEKEKLEDEILKILIQNQVSETRKSIYETI